MPSASSAKPEKQTSVVEADSSSTNSNQQNTPIRQAIVIIEHKIRNLDKRKAKLETYRQLREAGKDLNQDQKVAVEKYDEVLQTLEFAKDLCKQFHNIVTVSEKEAKKVARKEELARRQQDLAKIREVVLIQDALSQMGAENVREDFLLGRNGATVISPEDLQLLDDLYPIVSPKHATESEEGSPDFGTQVQQAAEHLLAVVDGKPKEFSGSTFARVKEVIDIVQNCGYLEKATDEVIEVVEEPLVIDDGVQNEYVEEHQQVVIPEMERIPDQMPPMPNFPPVPEQLVQVVPVEPYYAPPPPQPQPRPITEMLETGSFYFLQESELDTPPEIVPQHPQINPAVPIPSQTFTNQNFVPNAVPAINNFVPPSSLPPPIPMPPSHNPAIPVYQQDPAFNNQDFEYNQEVSKTPEHKNGTEDWSEPPEERPRPRNNNGNRNRTGNSSNNYYSNNFYQNNGYSGGSGGYNKSRGGSRQGGNGGRPSGPPGSKSGGQYNRNKPTQHQ